MGPFDTGLRLVVPEWAADDDLGDQRLAQRRNKP
jgi:hypothetical protein